MISARPSVNWLAVTLLLAVAGCQQQPSDVSTTSDSAPKISNDSATLQEVTLQITGMS